MGLENEHARGNSELVDELCVRRSRSCVGCLRNLSAGPGPPENIGEANAFVGETAERKEGEKGNKWLPPGAGP